MILDDSGKLEAFFYQDQEMVKNFAAYPEVLLMDATYKLNKKGITEERRSRDNKYTPVKDKKSAKRD